MAKASKRAAPVKKAAVKKTASNKAVTQTAKPVEKKKKPTINLKYSDKSAGQPELLEIFNAIKKMAEPYDGKGAMVLHTNTGGQFNLVSHKPVEIAGRKRNELWFISALVQKGYVGFYFMPVYMNEPMQKVFSPEFIKCLKGKACFHSKKNDPVIMKDIQKAFKLGYQAYKDRGWL